MGVARPDSDYDMAGVYVEPPSTLLGLSPPSLSELTKTGTNPDFTYHEVGKFCRMLAASNPNAMDMLWLTDYRYLNRNGQLLRSIRHLVLSDQIKVTYGGHVRAQIHKLEESNGPAMGPKYEKLVRHTFRPLRQVVYALKTGTMTLRIADPDGLRELATRPPTEVIKIAQDEYGEMLETRSVLRSSPDNSSIETTLMAIRGDSLLR